MRGIFRDHAQLFSYVSLESRVPAGHPLDLLARLSVRTRNESPHYGKFLLIKAEAISLKLLQESGPTSLRVSGRH